MLPPYHLSSFHQHQPNDRRDTDTRAVMYVQPTKPAHPKASLPCLTCGSALQTTIAHSPEGIHLETISRSYVCRTPAQAVNPCHSKAIESDQTTIAHSPEGIHLETISRSYVCRKPAQAVNPCHSKAIESDIPLGMKEVFTAWVAAARWLLKSTILDQGACNSACASGMQVWTM
jgi:hypothetical protein